jgi:hypothetical protein
VAPRRRLGNGISIAAHNSSPSDRSRRRYVHRILFSHHRISTFQYRLSGLDCRTQKLMLARRAISRLPVFVRSFSKYPTFPLLRSCNLERSLAYQQVRGINSKPNSTSSNLLASRIPTLPPVKKSAITAAAMSTSSASSSNGEVDLGNYEVLSEFSLEYAPVTVTKYRSKKTGFQVVVGNHKGELQ